MSKKLKVALAGNPNSGKTTIFNNLTGGRERVANYPGVTVEEKEGTWRHGEVDVTLVDLPGTYSLTAYSAEELVTRDYIINEHPDVVVDVLDASNLERSLYLAMQLMQMGVPLVLALNMSDEAETRGIKMDLEMLSKLLRVPIISTVGHKQQGMDELRKMIMAVADGDVEAHGLELTYGDDIELEIKRIEGRLQRRSEAGLKQRSRWLAVKLLEDDKNIKEKFASEELNRRVQKGIDRIKRLLGDTPEILIADRRYGFISGACQESVMSSVEARHTFSDKIDAVVINRVMGLPIFLALMYLLFQIAFTLGSYPMGWLETFFGWLAGTINAIWPNGGESVLRSLLVDGVISGVGGVLVFLPNILLLFMSIAFLEGTGYMARAAFIMDRLMHKIGLHGKSFIPMVIGFGCTVPAILATRTLETRRDRLTTMLVLPLMSCGARLTIYALIIPAFFPPAWRAPMLWMIYLIGVLLAIVAAKVLRVTLLRGESMPFVMELPPYRLPTLRSVLHHMWERAWEYVQKAGTIILGISIVLWALSSYPQKTEYSKDYDGLRQRAEEEYVASLHVIERDMNAKLPPDMVLSSDVRSGDVPQRFRSLLGMIKKIEAARSVTDESGLDPETGPYAALMLHRDSMLSQAEDGSPELYALAIRYLDEVRSPYEAEVSTLSHERQAEELSYSIAGRIGQAIEPVLRPMGFDWRIGTALIGAFAAKEVFVAQMGIVFAVGEAESGTDALRAKLRENYSPLIGFCVMLFCLISAPCVATLAATRQESNSWGWAIFQFSWLTIMAFVITTLVYQAGTFLGVGV